MNTLTSIVYTGPTCPACGAAGHFAGTNCPPVISASHGSFGGRCWTAPAAEIRTLEPGQNVTFAASPRNPGAR